MHELGGFVPGRRIRASCRSISRSNLGNPQRLIVELVVESVYLGFGVLDISSIDMNIVCSEGVFALAFFEELIKPGAHLGGWHRCDKFRVLSS